MPTARAPTRRATCPAVLPNRPVLGESTGTVSAGIGNFSAYDVSAVGNFAVGERSAIRLAGVFANRDGFFDDGTGDQFLGSPNLTDAIWLYGGAEDAIEYTVRNARFGVMPPWSAEASDAGRLSEAEVRAVAVYVHSLGGGQ